MTDNLPSEPQPVARIIAFGVVTLAVVAGAVLLVTTRPQPVQITINPPQPTATLQPTPTPAPIEIYVTGAVAQPESRLTLPPGSRVEDAIEAAGGALDTANMERVNLAAVLRDGDQVHVPEMAQETLLATPSGGDKVRINSASLEALMTLPGVGEALAGRIIAFREANGPFADLAALDEVSGVGPAMLANLEDLIVFD